MPEETTSCADENNFYDERSEILQVDEDENRNVVDIFSIHSVKGTGTSMTHLMCRFKMISGNLIITTFRQSYL